MLNTMYKHIKFILTSISILIHIYCIAQENRTSQKPLHFLLSGAYGHGKVLPTTPFVQGDNLKGEPIENYQFFSAKAIWQNPGYRHWQRVYRSPYYGVGLSLGDFSNPQEVGSPISCYGILGIPVKRWNNLETYTEFQYGMTGNWKHYDSITNPKNVVIGGGLTVHLDVAMKLFYTKGQHIDVGAGLSFIHFSNGGFERPNRGFNIYSPSLEFRYRFTERPNYKSIDKAEKLKRYNDLFIMTGYGDYQLADHELDSNYFAFAGFSFIYFSQLTNAFRLGAGSDLNYWWGLNANPDGTYAGYSFENITVGFIVQPEFIIGKLSLVGGMGIYALHRNFGNFEQIYQRLGVRYDVYKNLSFGVNIRAINFMLAEVLEFNLGYKIRWEKN